MKHKNRKTGPRGAAAQHFRALLAAVSLLSLAAPGSLGADPAPTDLTELSLDQLAQMKVTIASKHEEQLSQTPAAITVITQDDIRRSGVTSIPEVLRLVPGLDVARVDAHQWAITARGFNEDFPNKLLVMIDGRTVYTPLFAGVFWDVQDLMIEDIERIEVIRGPGASLWGANAVNGVINIITKKAQDTQGTLATASAGTQERGSGAVRYGGKIGDHTWFRVYGKYFNRDDSAMPDGGERHDGWWMNRGGFRLDYEPSSSDTLMLEGEIYEGRVEEIYRRLAPQPPFTPFFQPTNYRVAGGDLLGRWEHTLANDSKLTLQTYWDHTVRDIVILRDRQDIFDVDVQHQFALGDRQTVVWGGGYRLTSDHVGNSFDVALDPTHRSTNLFSAFVQDEIKLIEKRLTLTLGSKFENNDFTGFEIQPSGRLAWTPNERQTVWGAVSRAVRTPSRGEENIRVNQEPVFPANAFFPGSPALVTSIFGNPNLAPEKLIAYETGYRVQLCDRATLDIAGFYNTYDDLRSVDLAQKLPQFTASPPHVATRLGNSLEGEALGAELAASWQPKDWWRLQATYSFLDLQLHNKNKPTGDVPGDERNFERSTPQNQFSLRSSFDLPRGFEFDLWLRYVDSLGALQVPGYVTLDARLAWHPTRNLEFSIVGQNLIENRHKEFRATTILIAPAEIERGVYGKVTWHF
jgi:iron complex outermembrane recepter protein